MYGVFLDVTGRKQAEEANELLAGEMSHRVKNLIAIAASLTTMTSRSAETKEDMARELTHRLTALGRAHDLVRPVPGQMETAALLGDLFSVLLTPYDDLGAFTGRIRISVPRMGIGESAATNLALVLHELATNSVKHGALSVDTGLLDVACLVDDGVGAGRTAHSGSDGHQGLRERPSDPDHQTSVRRLCGVSVGRRRVDRDASHSYGPTGYLSFSQSTAISTLVQ
jgi:two-component sensor histidine kinase